MATTAPAQTQTQTLSKTLTEAPYAFLQPSTDLHASTLAYLKEIVDPLASSISSQQYARREQLRRKRKRGDGDGADGEVLGVKKVHVQGFGVEQVWEQVRRVVEAARIEAERGLADVLLMEADSEKKQSGDEELDGSEGLGSDAEEQSGSEIGEEGVDWEYDGEEVDGEEGSDPEIAELDGEDMGDEDLEMGSADEEDLDEEEPTTEYVADPNGLNDGFFSIDDFNRQSDFLEQADVRGDNDGAASDEEGIDWDANPLSAGPTTGKAGIEEKDEESEDDEDGPTFGNADLDAPEGASGDEDEDVEDGDMDGLGSLSNTNNITYADFFAPPAQKIRKNKRGRPNPHNFPAAQAIPSSAKDSKAVEADMERTMSAVHRDLFEDESEGEDKGSDLDPELDPADPRARRSTHERRRAALAEEIRRLEAANVAKRDWTLSGEARAAERPLNSLLEEDLEFERAGKPVPIITAEVSESIEELIKRRILAHDFQDIIRRRPDDLATGKDARRGRLDFELSDTKEKKSLAEMYEEEHLRATDPNFVDEKDEKTKKEEAEILALWRNVSGRLDSLSSWHFRPKAPQAQLDIRVDAPVVRLEDARPSAGAEAAGANQLAPQEVYKAGEAAEKAEEVITRGGMPVGREEMSREERKRRRRREKERGRKALSGDDATASKKKAAADASGGKAKASKKEVLGDLKKGGVKVIGSKGELKDVEGRAVKAGQGVVGAGAYKL